MGNRKLAIVVISIIVTIVISSFIKPLAISKKPDTNIVKYIIDPNITHQTIDNFGASDAWSIQYIGLWPLEKQKQIATWLFSTKNDSLGNPKGIGLSLWRFYIGAGSSEQGNLSEIDNLHRRGECFLLSDGTYNWQKHAGQRSFMQHAKLLGVNQFLGFIYSPPVFWTKNGLATNLDRNGSFNLREDKYDDYAGYVADIIERFEQSEGIKFSYISPFNEPDGHWNWDGREQEGTPATKYEIAKTARVISKEFEKRKLQTQILVPESSDLRCLYNTEPHVNAERGYQIQSYFTPDSTDTYIGNLYNVPRLTVGHSYWTNSPVDMLRDVRIKLNETLQEYNVRFWQSELCVMSNNTEIGGGHEKDLSMKTALYIARVIHHDMVYANSSAWHWWLAVTTGNYKDGLIYTDPNKNLTNGTFSDSKLMWSLGNYSRFIRPGARRINVNAYSKSGKIIPEGETDTKSIMISSYKNKDNSLVTVIINYSEAAKDIKIENKEKPSMIWQPYITSDTPGFNLKKQTVIKNNQINIPAKSIITLKEI
jgi:O-glycosyl hydrolase